MVRVPSLTAVSAHTVSSSVALLTCPAWRASCPQHGQGLGRQRHHLGVMPQRAMGPLQTIGTEVQGRSGGMGLLLSAQLTDVSET